MLGRLHPDPGGAAPDSFGLSLRDDGGIERVVLSVDDHGPTLVFVKGGNIAIQLGVDDPELPGDHEGAFITLADARGVPLFQVSAEADGSLAIRVASEPTDPEATS